MRTKVKHTGQGDAMRSLPGGFVFFFGALARVAPDTLPRREVRERGRWEYA